MAGVGVDRIRIDRIAASLRRFGARFERRVYAEGEVIRARLRGNPSRRYAMLFAGKEAVAKALGTGFAQGVAPRHIEIVHQASGKPEVVLHAAARQVAARLGVVRVHVSMSDDDGVAMAFAVAEVGP
ncbi:MAG: holo-[acyl-carrier-protein] synthase [Zetaproteobacteria bacterium]|nr:MAG: holo-[acyl-carrier-protein] synthase [Zetaproteobacteria bacterium]